ncbi:RND family efflux transporter MFP subunit [Candidatus Nitrosoglobus terrae]|uniref:RND family efflux transporter MFP subunit n=1 Tax=Candidatus Nitrosoglobus terrae TaxID=1630141 RepID=A0A1Q2SMV8_9GAMM|nr:efflux RND transporter periplasmic adaptor subunit [Candidatus Nitrosoglobus terrae]BAW80485.1 RND family efflux transporter MFP subunit [Candidatus Nitrosoglobus terrae]
MITSSLAPSVRDRSRLTKRIVIFFGFLIIVISLLAITAWKYRPLGAIPIISEKTAVTALAGSDLIFIQLGSLLEQKLQFSVAHKEILTTPLLSATGAVMARLRSGHGDREESWQFSSLELSGIYTNWQRVRTEIKFATRQLEKTKELAAAQIHSHSHLVERLRKLVATGTEAPRDLASAEASLLQIQLEGQKAVFEVESALTQAIHSRTNLERDLLQAGIDPAQLEKASADAALVMADVPETKISLVAVGQRFEARFYGLPNQLFHGVVSSLAPALSSERRTLRVFFELDDQDNQLKPGMYAEIGLGTDPRQVILVPADGVLHITESDYVLTDSGEGLWKITKVQVGEQVDQRVEILHGVDEGERLIGNGAILLKPLLVQALKK